MKTPSEILKNWETLNEGLMKGDEELATKLLKAELRGLNREAFVNRIHSRLNRLRRQREREELHATRRR